MTRTKKMILSVVLVLLSLPLISLAVLLATDWNKARPWLNDKTSKAIGRPFAIRGDLALTWEKMPIRSPGAQRRWSDLLPWPHLVANDVHVGNPATMPDGELASVHQLSFSLSPLALLAKRIVVPELRFDAPTVDLLRKPDGSNNWTFRQEEHPSPWQLDLERVVFTKGQVHYTDALHKADIHADVDTTDDAVYGVLWKAQGKFNNTPMTGSGKAGAVLSLKRQEEPFPLQAEVKVGGSRIAVKGTLTKPTELAALDLQLQLSGPSMARLDPLIGMTLPETPAYSTEGHLLGTVSAQSSTWTYEHFKGKVGSSDIAGRLVFQAGAPRGKLSGEVVSRLLQFTDLGPLIGADSNASKAARGVAPVQPAGKVLPVEGFSTERWKAMDADVKFSATQIVREKQLPISNLSTHLMLNAGVLTLDPLVFDIAGGNMNTTIKLDGSGDTIHSTLKLTARHIHIKELFPAIEGMQASVGQINGDAQLTASGNSVAALLGGSNGEVKAVLNQGTVSKLLLEEMGLNLGNVVLAKLFGDKQVKLNCMVSDFAVNKGLMQSRMFIVDTEDATITAEGTINLSNEELDMTLHPDTKGLRVFSLRTPLHVKGTFSKPDVGVDKGMLALKAGGALALAAFAAPAAALLPLVNTGPGENSECAQVLGAVKAKSAPPPAKKR